MYWVLMRRWAIAGTLDAVRGLTWLTELYLNKNNIGGMSACTNFEIFVLQCVDRVARQRAVSISDLDARSLAHRHTPMRHHGITGTLDPVRHLTGLSKLNLGFNGIGGASFSLAAVGIVLVCI